MYAAGQDTAKWICRCCIHTTIIGVDSGLIDDDQGVVENISRYNCGSEAGARLGEHDC